MASIPPVELSQLPDPDLVSLCALKLMIEVDVQPLAAFEVAEVSSRPWQLDYLASGPGLIGPEPVDAACLGRARAWAVEVARQRRMAQLRGESLPSAPRIKAAAAHHPQTAWRQPLHRPELSASQAAACATFEALAHVEASPEPEWIDISEVIDEPAVPAKKRPSRPDSVVVCPVSAPAGFAPIHDPWALPGGVTATLMHAA